MAARPFNRRTLCLVATGAFIAQTFGTNALAQSAPAAQEFTRLMNAERPQWTAAIKAAGIATKKD